jgi:hypothetical protein
VDQLRPPTCSSPEHHRSVSKHEGSPTTESQGRNIARASDDFRHGFTTDTSCHPHSYLLITEECPDSKDLDDPLQQWWHDEDSHSNYDGRVHVESHAEHYDLCSAHDSQGVLPNTHYVYNDVALSPTTRRHDDDTHFSTPQTTIIAHLHDISLPKDSSLNSRQGITPGIGSLTRELHQIYVGTTSADIRCVRTLPDTMHHHDVTQSQTLSTCDHCSQGLTTDATTSTTTTRQATATRGQHEMTNNIITRITRAEQARLTTLLSDLE